MVTGWYPCGNLARNFGNREQIFKVNIIYISSPSLTLRLPPFGAGLPHGYHVGYQRIPRKTKGVLTFYCRSYWGLNRAVRQVTTYQRGSVDKRVLHVCQSAPEGVTLHVYRSMLSRFAKVCPNGSCHTATLKPYQQNSVFEAVFCCPAIVGVVFCHSEQ